jgi:hypothetical protein|uniref:Uncharacterized protein n=1 Tax=Populus trichocarpa TaxID=3694 RepID=A0A2K1R5V0_POPTR
MIYMILSDKKILVIYRLGKPCCPYAFGLSLAAYTGITASVMIDRITVYTLLYILKACCTWTTGPVELKFKKFALDSGV